ncbi:hypothetical protein [Nissabacter sp. SGAir0207]|uniref:hypothetical protein n=1 Tax=Nissabacter sp. SGAir0207 TaxID=2126321 RepID=UPI0010CCF80B|nr:hypothetical protein [Nissabacter sp. SGAir0207]QCR38725.1 hypothetical protein C1N62_21555 [Nissabacter sp. SGAir0207]
MSAQDSYDDEPQFGWYAMIPNNSDVVELVVETLNTFKMPGYTLVLIPEGVACEAGMIYNAADGTFSYPVEESETS